MSMGKVLGGGSSVNANSSGYRDLALLGERFHDPLNNFHANEKSFT
jgi:hypothetical protein